MDGLIILHIYQPQCPVEQFSDSPMIFGMLRHLECQGQSPRLWEEKFAKVVGATSLNEAF